MTSLYESYMSMWAWFSPFPLEFGEATLADAADLATLHATAFYPGWSTPEFEAMLAQDEVLCFVARRASYFSSRRPVGFVMLRLALDEAEVLTLVISPAHQRRGLAKKLMTLALRRLYFERVKALFLEVNESNIAARRLYEGLQFVQVGKRPNYYPAQDGTRTAALVLRVEI